jgi:hypothetical protein
VKDGEKNELKQSNIKFTIKKLYCHGFSSPKENLCLRSFPKVLRTRKHKHRNGTRSPESESYGNKSSVDLCQAEENVNTVREGNRSWILAVY